LANRNAGDFLAACRVEHRHGVGPRVRHVNRLAVGRQRQPVGMVADVNPAPQRPCSPWV
jgi:hypothetical protein